MNNQSHWGLKGRRILVTGAGGGIGTALVHALLVEGASVIGSDRSDADLEHLRSLESPDLSLTAMDLTVSAAVEQSLTRIEAEQGPIDAAASVAGVLHSGPLVDTDDAEWDRVMSVNAKGVFCLYRALARRMIPRRRGSLVTVSSNAGSSARHGLAVYGASKAAASLLTRALALELGPHGIRCNVVAPGSTDTAMLRDTFHDDYGIEQVIHGSPAAFRTGIPLGRIASPDDIVEAILFFLSDRSRHITMAELVVDGGATQ